MTAEPLPGTGSAPVDLAGALPRPGLLARVREAWDARHDAYYDQRAHAAADWADIEQREYLGEQWRRTCEGLDLVRKIDTVTGVTITTPAVERVILGPLCARRPGPLVPAPATVLRIRLLPGMIPADIAEQAHRIAPHLGAVSLRVRPVDHYRVDVELVHVDPLASLVTLTPGPGVMLGTADDSTVIREDWRSVGHMIVQGSTRSGKSAFTYALLAQLSECAVIGGSDPTGLLFRPFAGTRHEQWQASGLVDLGAHEYALTAAVEEMDKRIRDIPAHRDTVPPSVPLLVIVLEELPGLLRALDVADKDRGKRCRALIARLLAEGAKAGLRVVMLAQRAEASIIGAAERAQASLRLSFRVDNRASVELLHPGCPPAVADAHTAALPGIGLLTAPGRPLTRLRAPLLGGDPDGLYAAYIAAVRRSHGLL